MVIAADRQAGADHPALCARPSASRPMLRQLIEAERQDAIDLSNRISVETHTASFRTTRGYTVVAALLDEIAFWPTEDSANPDTEIISAIRPSMATIPSAMLLCASSPYSRKGALWEIYHRYFAQPGPVLVWQAGTRCMNPWSRPASSPPSMRRTRVGRSRIRCSFRNDIETFVSREAIESRHQLRALEYPSCSGVAMSALSILRAAPTTR